MKLLRSNLNFKKIRVLLAMLTALFIIFILLFETVFKIPNEISSYDKFRSNFTFSNSFLFAKDGRLLNSIRSDLKKRNLFWTDLSQIDPKLITEVLYQEDRRFYRHVGVDPLAFAGALRDLVLDDSPLRGASTITMQLAKLSCKLNTRNTFDKLKQLAYALQIESNWSKEQILEAYFNSVVFHSDIQGIGSATLMLLGKMPANLTPAEVISLRKKIRRPNTPLSPDLLKNTETESENLAEHLHQNLLKTQRFNSLISEVDYDLQKQVITSVSAQLDRLKLKNVTDAAVVVIRNSDKAPVVYVGNSGKRFSSTPYVDMVHSRRPAGSTLKPFLYALAIEKKLINYNSWIDDSALDIIFENGTYSPKNHDKKFYGWVRVPTALASSLNVPAVKIIQLTGVENFWNTLRELNFKPAREPEHYGPSLALGSIDVSLWDLTLAYSQFAQPTPEFIFSEQTRNIMNWILSQPQHRTLTFGLDSILNVDPQFAIKTGTSKDMKDNWSIGYNRDYTIGVWVGNSDNSSMHNVLGVTGAAPILREVADYMKSKSYYKTAALVSEQSILNFQTGMNNADSPEAFTRSRITSPAQSTIYAIDPAIPRQNQKIFLEADGPQENLVWKFNGVEISGNRIDLKKGRHQVELYRNNKKIDESNFLVK